MDPNSVHVGSRRTVDEIKSRERGKGWPQSKQEKKEGKRGLEPRRGRGGWVVKGAGL